MKKAATRVLLLVGALLLFYVVGVVVRGRYGIRISIRNQSGEILRHAALKEQTHGPRYSLGDTGIGQRKRMFIQPKTEAHIELLFDDAAGMQHSELAVGYVERGYCGPTHWHVDALFCDGSWIDFLR